MRETLKGYIENSLKDGFLLIACGLPGTGKSTAAQAVYRIKGGRLFTSDVIRRELFKDVDVTDPAIAGDAKQRERVYEEMFRQADEALAEEKNVIMDATFITQTLRQQAATIAAWRKTAFIILETVCPEDICLKRILARDKAASVSNALTEEAYISNKKRYEVVHLHDFKRLYPKLKIEHITVATGEDQPYVIKYEQR